MPATRPWASIATSLTEPPTREAMRRARGAEWLLLRADHLGDLSPDSLRTRAVSGLIYALRTRAARGHADPSDPQRARRLREASLGHDLVELEAPHDLVPEVLDGVPPHRRLISWRGAPEGLDALRRRLLGLRSVGAAVYRLSVESRGVADGLPPLQLLREQVGRDLVACAEGEAGVWSRVLSASLGAPMVFDPFGDGEPGRPRAGCLVDDYGLPEAPPVLRIFGIVGQPVAHSLSPRLHNAAYRALGIPALFLPFPTADLAAFWDAMVANGALERLGAPLGGLTISSPHKESALAIAEAVSPAARRAGSANLLHRRWGRWVADTTDPHGVVETLRRRGIAIAGRRAAVVGCGGSGRAIAEALARAGAEVVLSNRGRARGELASERLGLPLVELSSFDAGLHDLIVNATPVGREGDRVPFDVGRLAPRSVVVDLVYADGPTPLALAASSRGATVIVGREVLLVQASRQFARMTGRAMPIDLAARELGLARATPHVPGGAAGPTLASNRLAILD